jgi:hypothetical protein
LIPPEHQLLVMAGLDPAIHAFGQAFRLEDVDAGTSASEATAFFERLWPGMTVSEA